MSEAFLHYVWSHQRFNSKNLVSTKGFNLEVIYPGEYNDHAGPDFFNSRIRINDTLWAGTVEIHIRSSEWYRHGHNKDTAYDNCILHVVNEYDSDVYNCKGQEIVCLELKDLLPDKLFEHYLDLIETQTWIPCAHRILETSELNRHVWLDVLATDRLKSKTVQILELLETNNMDWELTFFQCLSSGFGFQVNAIPFYMLSRSFSLHLIKRNRDKLHDVEAIFFGCAGMLNAECEDEYYKSLQETFDYYRNAHNLSVMDISAWKFLRMRPVNFPTIRIAQLAALMTKSENLFSEILELPSYGSGMKLMEVTASEYWTNHYLFGKQSVRKEKMLGAKSIENLFINVIAPVLFAYGQKYDLQEFRQKAIDLLEQIPAEDNSIIRSWDDIGINARTALQSQALLELKKNYCSKKKCLTCRIGNELMNRLP